MCCEDTADKASKHGLTAAAEGRAHGVFTDRIKAPKLYTQKLFNWADAPKIQIHTFLVIYDLYINNANYISLYVGVAASSKSAALTNKTGLSIFQQHLNASLLQRFSRAFLATQEVELLLPADHLLKLSRCRLSRWNLNTAQYQS